MWKKTEVSVFSISILAGKKRANQADLRKSEVKLKVGNEQTLTIISNSAYHTKAIHSLECLTWLVPMLFCLFTFIYMNGEKRPIGGKNAKINRCCSDQTGKAVTK